jgi:hypothetical protein
MRTLTVEEAKAVLAEALEVFESDANRERMETAIASGM